VEYAALGGGTALRVSRVGFGCAPLSSYDYGRVEPSAVEDAVRAALDSGVTLFDVADVYGFGSAEELLGRALGARRKDVVIATKFGLRWDPSGRVRRDSRPAVVLEALEDSLRRLGVDAIPLYQLHWPDGLTPLETIVELMEKCRQAGKVRFFGVCNCSLEVVKAGLEAGGIASVQVAHNLLCRDAESELLQWCQETRLGVLAHSGLARGFLSGNYAVGCTFAGTDTRNRSAYFAPAGGPEKERLLQGLREIAARVGRPVASVALRWILEDARVTAVLVGVKRRGQLEQAVAGSDWRLGTGDRELLTTLSTNCPDSLTGVLARA
jgi:myo-inositol catabolism protein IolS